VAPAVALVLHDDSLLRAELGHAPAELGVAVRVEGRAESADRADAGRAAEARHRRVHLGDVGGIDPDQRQVVEGAGIGIGLALRLHRQPGVVDEGPGLAGAVNLHRRSDRQRAARTAVGFGLGARWRNSAPPVQGRRWKSPRRRSWTCTERLR